MKQHPEYRLIEPISEAKLINEVLDEAAHWREKGVTTVLRRGTGSKWVLWSAVPVSQDDAEDSVTDGVGARPGGQESGSRKA